MRVQAFHGEKELFLSDHFDQCSVKTVMAKCRVLSLSRYQELANVEDHDFFARFTYRVRKAQQQQQQQQQQRK
jgi:hypothetical protein